MKFEIFKNLRKINKLYLIKSIIITTIMFSFVIAFALCFNILIETIISFNLPIDLIFYFCFIFGFFCIIVYAIYQIQLDLEENKSETKK